MKKSFLVAAALLFSCANYLSTLPKHFIFLFPICFPICFLPNSLIITYLSSKETKKQINKKIKSIGNKNTIII